MHDAEKTLARFGVVLGGALQRFDEAGQSGQRRAQLMAGIGDEVGAHFLDPAQRRLVMKRHQHAGVGAAEMRRHRNRGDQQFHPAVHRDVVEIGGAARLGGGDGFAQSGDDLGRAQRELCKLIAAQRRCQLPGRGIEMQHAPGAIEQHGRIGHAGDDGAHRRRFHRIDAQYLFARGGLVVQPPRHQRRAGDADEGNHRALHRQLAEQHEGHERQPGHQQDDRGMPQPVWPRRKHARGRSFNDHLAGSFPAPD